MSSRVGGLSLNRPGLGLSLNLFLDSIPNPGVNLVLLLLIPHLSHRLHLLNIEVSDGPKVIPSSCRVLSGSVSLIVDDTEALSRGDQVTSLEITVAGLANGAHGSKGNLSRGRKGANEALEDDARGAGVGWEVDVDVRYKGSCGVGDEEDRDDSTEGYCLFVNTIR